MDTNTQPKVKLIGFSNKCTVLCKHTKQFNDCNECIKSFADKISLDQRLLFHRRQDLCYCEICGSRCSKSGLKSHMFLHHRIKLNSLDPYLPSDHGDGGYLCAACGNRFNSKSSLQVHTHVTEDAIFPCLICKSSFHSVCDLNIHKPSHDKSISGENPKEQKTFICEICGSMCYSKYDLTVHMRVHFKKELWHKIRLSRNESSLDQKHIHNKETLDIKPFVCHICITIFKTAKALACHIRKHKHKKIRHCDICGYLTLSEFELYHHKEKHSSNKQIASSDSNNSISEGSSNNENISDKLHNSTNYISIRSHHDDIHRHDSLLCEICGKIFKQKQYYIDHKNWHTGEKPYVCKICQTAFYGADGLCRHRLAVHTEKKTCDKCGKILPEKSFKKHVCNKPRTILSHVCHICEKVCMGKSAFKTHMHDQHGEKLPQPKELYQCDTCGKKFKQKYYFTAHKRLHSGQGKVCSICNKMFPNNNLHKQHMLTHTGKRDHVCEICGKRFRAKYSLNLHIRAHKGLQPFHCDKCQKVFNSKFGLEAHIRTHLESHGSEKPCHGSEKPYHCQLCPKKFTSKTNFMNHQNKHTGVKPFVCPECGEAFSSSIVLSYHKQIHNGPYTCEICNKSFNKKLNLKHHQVVHSDETPYQCKLCPRRFKTNQHLKRHIKNHSEKRESYSCMVCEKVYTQKRNLGTHLKTHNKDIVKNDKM